MVSGHCVVSPTFCVHSLELIVVFQNMGMTINFTKSMLVILLSELHGDSTSAASALQKPQTSICPAPNRSTLGPYYHTTTSRAAPPNIVLKKAEATYHQLRKVLRTNGALTAPHRLRIYNAIVVSSLFYGLVSVGVTAEVVRKVSSDIADHLRKILRIHEQGISNEQVLLRGGISPLQLLQHRAQRLKEHILHDPGRSSSLKLSANGCRASWIALRP